MDTMTIKRNAFNLWRKTTKDSKEKKEKLDQKMRYIAYSKIQNYIANIEEIIPYDINNEITEALDGIYYANGNLCDVGCIHNNRCLSGDDIEDVRHSFTMAFKKLHDLMDDIENLEGYDDDYASDGELEK